MCVTAVIAGVSLLAAAGQGAASIASANANKAGARYERDMQQKQARERERALEIQALETENARAAELEAARSTSMAAIGASGLGEHISFFQGMDVENQQQFLRDVRNVRLNLTQAKAGIADEIEVSGFNYKIAKANSTFAKVAAVSEFAQAAASAGSSFARNKIPAKSGSTGGTGTPKVTLYNVPEPAPHVFTRPGTLLHVPGYGG